MCVCVCGSAIFTYFQKDTMLLLCVTSAHSVLADRFRSEFPHGGGGSWGRVAQKSFLVFLFLSPAREQVLSPIVRWEEGETWKKYRAKYRNIIPIVIVIFGRAVKGSYPNRVPTALEHTDCVRTNTLNLT